MTVAFLFFNEKRVLTTAVVSLYNNYEEFSWQSHISYIQKQWSFSRLTSFSYLKKQNIRPINPETSKTNVHKCSYNIGCRVMHYVYTIYAYGLIPPLWSNIVNPIISSKPRWCARFGWTMVKYSFYIATSQSGVIGQGNTQPDAGTILTDEFCSIDRYTYGNRDHISNQIEI